MPNFVEKGINFSKETVKNKKAVESGEKPVEANLGLLAIAMLGLAQKDGKKASVVYERVRVKEQEKPPLGFGFARIQQWATCGSEVGYYGSGRFEKETANTQENTVRIDRIWKRNVALGLTSDPVNEILKEKMPRTMFHEGFVYIDVSTPDVERKPVQVQVYTPKINGKGFDRKLTVTNFQSGLEVGRMAIVNPALICDDHSSAVPIDGKPNTGINPATGWPNQCPKVETLEHKEKVTDGHGKLGVAIEGRIPVRLDSLTPVPQDLQKWVEEDSKNRHMVLTQVEPMGCVFDAWGTVLKEAADAEDRGEKSKLPESVLIVGDGSNALLNVMFLSVLNPKAKIVVSGKYQEKLESIKRVNPEQVTTILSDGTSITPVQEAMEKAIGNTQADVVLPTVNLEEEWVSPLVKDKGTIIWWASKKTQQAVEGGSVLVKGTKKYNERNSYGGAPRSEYSAVALMQYYALHRPEAVKALVEYRGIHYLNMGDGVAEAVEKWLNGDGRYTIAPDGKHDPTGKGKSVKLVVNNTI